MIDLRKNFPITQQVKYLNTANHSPPSTHVKKAIQDFLDDWDNLKRNGDYRVELANQSFAKLIGAEMDEIACQPNTSRGLATIASSLEFNRGENIIVNDLENWANIYPWTLQRRVGVDVRIVLGQDGAILLDDIEKKIDDNTKVVAISQVQWLTGARHNLKPLAELCHEYGAYLVVDGIQAAGALEIDVKKEDVDFFACGSYKWLLGPSGAGFLYAKNEHLETLKPTQLGYRAIRKHNLEEPVLYDNAKKLEFGEPSYLSFVGTKASLDYLIDVGMNLVEENVVNLAQQLYEGLNDLNVEIVSPEDKKLRSGIVSFKTQNLEEHFQSLTRSGFILSLRPAGIRVSVDFFNNSEEVDSLVESVEKLIR